MPAGGSSSKSESQFDIGTLEVKIYEGDITKESVECIVNSTNDDLDLSRGAVSRSLLRIAGKRLQEDADKQKRTMKREGVALTSAPRLPCQHIIHAVARDNVDDWKDTVRQCLDLAENSGIASIAFPALGTGQRMSAKEIATTMYQTIVEFENAGPQNLCEIRIVIFQLKMVRDFITAFQGGAQKSSGGLLSKFASLVGMGGKPKTAAKMPRPAGKKSRQNYSNPNEVVFTVYAMQTDTITQAINRLQRAMEKEIISKEFKETVITRLSAGQIAELKSMAEQKHVDIEVRRDDGRIFVKGVAGNIMNAADKIHNVFRDAERIAQQDNEATMMVNLVQWYYIEVTDVGQKLEKYDKHVNYLIEKHYQDNKPFVSFSDSSGNQYKLDFTNMEEYPANSPDDTVQVIRRDLMKDASFEPPPEWSQMAKNENLRVISLAPTDKDYLDVAGKFNASSGSNYTIVKFLAHLPEVQEELMAYLRHWRPYSVVVIVHKLNIGGKPKIERIQNMTLYQQYAAKKKLLDQQNPAGHQNEHLLWHGTNAESVDSINAHGFNRSYCGKNATAFGDGVYFAVQASYSCSNTYSRPDTKGQKRLYYSLALTGVYTLGKAGMRVPPAKPGASSHEVYDSVVNSMGAPSMYIIFHDTQAYPQYLVTFRP